MRAVTAPRYGGPEVLQLEDRPEPKVGPDAVLVRVQASSINPVDYKVVRGYLDGAFRTVFPLIPGWDVAGVVEAVGPAVGTVQVGQPVYGYARMDYIGDGAWADLVAVPVRGVAPMPTTLEPGEAACVPLAGMTAWQALTDALQLGAGDTLLVHGASGGVGTMAVQLAVARGARVIGTSSDRSADHVRGLGGEHVTYGEGLVERVRELAPHGVDAVFDIAGGEALASTPQVLRTPGRLVSVVDAEGAFALGGRYVFVRPEAADLRELATLIDAGAVRPHIDRRWPLEQVAEAVAAAEAGGFAGKLVLDVG